MTKTIMHSLLATTALALAPPAFAQAAGENDVGLAEIVVTAQKREQNLQDVPIAVTAITSDNLQTNRVTSVSDLSGLAPGVGLGVAAADPAEQGGVRGAVQSRVHRTVPAKSGRTPL